MKKERILITLIIVFFSSVIFGQNKTINFFEESAILDPFLSEIRSVVIKTEFAFINKLDNNYYVNDYTERPFIEPHLGIELPIFNYENNLKKVKFNISGEIGNILLIDMFEEITAPVINTDYFFGLKTGILKYTENRKIKNFGFKIVPVFHESTHIGDEFSLHGFINIPEFKRVNISYEAWEIAGVINDPDTIKSNLISVKAGLQGLWNMEKGFYTTDTLETKGVIVPPNKKGFEYYFQLNIQRTKGFLCSPQWMQILSIESRNRVKFSYDITIPETRTWNYNLYLGWKHISEKANKNIGFFLRYYNGIIPNGQFRNADGYNYIALSIIYD